MTAIEPTEPMIEAGVAAFNRNETLSVRYMLKVAYPAMRAVELQSAPQEPERCDQCGKLGGGHHPACILVAAGAAQEPKRCSTCGSLDPRENVYCSNGFHAPGEIYWPKVAQEPDDALLPCDVKLPPATTIHAGCKLSTLIHSLELRGMVRIEVAQEPVDELIERWKGEVYLDLNERRNPGTDEFAKGFNGGIIEARGLIYAKLPALLNRLQAKAPETD